MNCFIPTGHKHLVAWYLDSHIHLSDSAYGEDLGDILEQMRQLQIRACCVSTNLEDSKRTLAIAKESALVLPFVGLHPEFAGAGASSSGADADDDPVSKIVHLAEQNRDAIAGIGEIGLDPTFGGVSAPAVSGTGEECGGSTDAVRGGKISKSQILAFESMLDLAERLDKPISIHSRGSLDAVFEMMSSYNTRRALLHWFDGSKRQLRKAMDMGFFVSYGPVMVYANDKQSLLSRTDRDRILVETDGPVRFSRCFEMRQGQVSFIPSVIFSMSDILDMPFDDAVSLLEKNAASYLGMWDGGVSV